MIGFIAAQLAAESNRQIIETAKRSKLRPWPKRMTEGYRTGLWIRAYHKLPPMFDGEMDWRLKNCPQEWRNPGHRTLATPSE